ncbi:MAG: DUF434 domain-containing protein [Ruminococcus sp.]|nr:DUF434 domain-containing protein [Ruminococcus sp.]
MENQHTPKQVKRGFVPTDAKEFGTSENLEKLRKSAEEVYFLVNRGYAMKNAVTFVGNHHLISERQRTAVARSVSPAESIKIRKSKELSDSDVAGKTLYIDGFNAVITLEIAYSDSMLFKCMDGTIRDIAGLRGTYRLIDKTDMAVNAIAETLTSLGIGKAVFYLDAPVSNSGRLKQKILEIMKNRPFETEVYTENAVDSILESKSCVVTADAVILDRCGSWYNLTDKVIRNHIGNYRYIDIMENTIK